MGANEIGLGTSIYFVTKERIYTRKIQKVEIDSNKKDVVVVFKNGDWARFKNNENISYTESGLNGSGYLELDDAHKQQQTLRAMYLDKQRRELEIAQNLHYEAILLVNSPFSEIEQW